MNNIDQNKLKILNDIYLSVLGRNVDDSGVKQYINYIHRPKGIDIITNQLMKSKEFRDKSHNNTNKLNTMAGDRTSYIDKNINDIIRSPYKDIFRSLIKELILLDNKNYTENELISRIETVEKSLSHMARHNISLTIFPHKEYHFNSDTFNDSLRDINNFKYWIYFLCISNLWKHLYNKIVPTCGTKLIVNQIITNKDANFITIFTSIHNYILDYLSIRIVGRILESDEKNKCISYIQNNNSKDLIDYLYELNHTNYLSEMNIANNNIINLTNKLGRKPTVLVMIAYLETQNPYFIFRMMDNLNKLQAYNPLLVIDFALDNERIDKESTDYTPWSRVKRIRNLMIKKYPIHNYDYLYIIDSDIIDYPLNFPTRAIGLNPNGITAPMALIQNSVVFYDWCGYQKLGVTSINNLEYSKSIMNKSCNTRNFKLIPPYVNDLSRLVKIDCVGCTYVVPSSIFKSTYGNLQPELLKVFDLAKVKNHKIKENIVQYEDHPTFTDHYTVCTAIRANGGDIIMDRGSPAYHADLPIHGEAWH